MKADIKRPEIVLVANVVNNENAFIVHQYCVVWVEVVE